MVLGVVLAAVFGGSGGGVDVADRVVGCDGVGSCGSVGIGDCGGFCGVGGVVVVVGIVVHTSI